MGNVLEKFITPLRPFFADPKMPSGTPVEEFYAGLIEDLGGFSDVALELAAKNLRANREYHTFPSLAECLGYCKAARNELYGKALGNAPPPDPYPEWSEERQRWAESVMCGARGLRYAEPAAEEGWIVSLWDFIRENHRLPNDNEARGIRKAHNEREKDLQNGGVGMWEAVRVKMLMRRNDLNNLVRRALHANHR